MLKLIQIFILILFVREAWCQGIKITSIALVPQSLVSGDAKTFNSVGDSVMLTFRRQSIFVYFGPATLNTTFAYKLTGITLREIYTRNSYAFFNNLPSGEYRFTVRAVRKPELGIAKVKILVESPIWLRWWFLPLMCLYALIAIGLFLYLLYRYRLRQLTHLHLVRENIARDLHDDMGSYLSSISISSQSIATLIKKDPQKALVLIEKIGETARQVIESMTEIIWSVNPENDSMQQISIRLQDIGSDLLREQEFFFSADVPEVILQTLLPLEKRRDFFLIYKEALNNIVKHAQATHVHVSLGNRKSSLLLVIVDNGLGFDQEKNDKPNSINGNGLNNMKARAEKMGGKLFITTDKGQGCKISVEFS